MENQKAKLQNWTKTGSKVNGEKKERQKGIKMGKIWICPFAFFFGIVFAFSICILFAFILFFFFGGGLFANFFPFWLNRTNRKSKQKCKWTSSFFPMFFPLFDCPFFSPFFTLLFFAFVFFGFCWFAFWFFHFFCTCLVFFFSSLLILRISYGLVNITFCFLFVM